MMAWAVGRGSSSIRRGPIAGQGRGAEMSSDTGDLAGKPRKRRDPSTPKRPEGKRAKLTLYLDADLAKRFAVHAEMMDLDKSELFAELVRAGCRRFVVSDRERGPGSSVEPEIA